MFPAADYHRLPPSFASFLSLILLLISRIFDIGSKLRRSQSPGGSRTDWALEGSENDLKDQLQHWAIKGSENDGKDQLYLVEEFIHALQKVSLFSCVVGNVVERLDGNRSASIYTSRMPTLSAISVDMDRPIS